MIIKSLLPLMVLLAAAAPHAIVIRHDRADAQYRALAEKFPAVSSFGRAGAATLVAPQWVVTAAHVAAHMRREGLSRWAWRQT